MKTSPHIQSKQAVEEINIIINNVIQKVAEYIRHPSNGIGSITQAGQEIENTVTSSHISLLQSVIEMVRKEHKKAEKFVPFQKIHYQSALEDIIKKIEEEIKQI